MNETQLSANVTISDYTAVRAADKEAYAAYAAVETAAGTRGYATAIKAHGVAVKKAIKVYKAAIAAA